MVNRTVRTRSKSSGMMSIETALVLSIIIPLLLGAWLLTSYFRTLYYVGRAATIASEAYSSGEYNKLSGEGSHLHWEHIENPDSDAIPYRPFLSLVSEQCRNTANPAECLNSQLSPPTSDIPKNLSAVMWQGYENNDLDVKNLPFRLYQEPTQDNQGRPDGYYPVQTLPLVGIRHGCVDPYHERPTEIDPNEGRVYHVKLGENLDQCRHVKPIYWYSPHRADFDGDNKEDLVFFQPRGGEFDETDIKFASRAYKDEVDFIVFKSGSAYNAVSGIITFDITHAPINNGPAAIPVVYDYDRDGISDFGVYEPDTSDFKIALSSVRFRTIIKGNLGLPDPKGKNGYIAIPGNFDNTQFAQIAVFPTAHENPEQRYAIQTTGDLQINIPILKRWNSSFAKNDTFLTPEKNELAFNYTIPTLKTGFDVKPHRGASFRPAYADWDDDGITEIGGLVTYPTNLAVRVAGAVPEPNARPGDSGWLDDLVDEDGEGFALDYRINPFDTALDRKGNLYVVDSIDSRVVKFMPKGRGELHHARAILPAHYGLPNRTDVDETSFPLHNVWNIPPEEDSNYNNRVLLGAGSLNNGLRRAGDRPLRSPRRIATSPEGMDDYAMYVADWGNGRIVRVQGTGGEFNLDDYSSVVLGSHECVPAGSTCVDLGLETQSPGNYKEWQDGNGDGRFKIWPSAIETVRLDRRRYAVVFSSGYGVFMIEPAPGESGGPVGRDGERIYQIAGDAHLDLVSANSEGEGLFALTFFERFLNGAREATTYIDLENRHSSANTATCTSSNHDSALCKFICPVVDIEHVENSSSGGLSNSLLLASSCSTKVYPGQEKYTTSTPYDYSELRNSGGILKLTKLNSTFAGENRLNLFAGGFYNRPCWSPTGTNTKCIEPVDTFGFYHRFTDITARGDAIKEIDLINPSNISITPDGNRLYFINQWHDTNNQDKIGDLHPNNGEFTRTALKTTDKQHHQGIFILDLDEGGAPLDITPLDNPWQRGNNTIPTESAHFYAPYTTDGNPTKTEVVSYESSIKHIPFPAVASIALNDSGYLYASTPYMQYQNLYPEHTGATSAKEHPYYTEPENIGFIYRVQLDTDGDGISDYSDSDLDGDNFNNADERSISQGSPSCAYAWGVAGGNIKRCRVQEKIGSPKVFFKKINGSGKLVLDNYDGYKIPNPKINYAEYFVMNTLGDGCSTERCEVLEGVFDSYYAEYMRPKALTMLLNYGDDVFIPDDEKILDPDNHSPCQQNPLNDTREYAYTYCAETSNGPIIAPTTLHSFSGYANNEASDLVESSYFGKGFLLNTSSGSNELNYELTNELGFESAGHLLFPTILSSSRPKEDGISPVARPRAESGFDEVKTSGILCKDYSREKVLSDKSTKREYSEFSKASFSYNLQDIRHVQFYTSMYIQGDIGITRDNDNLSYYSSCSLPYEDEGDPYFDIYYPEEYFPGIEGLILGLNHDETQSKVEHLSATGPSIASETWPHPWVIGPISEPENLRQFLLIDTDGDGSRNPSWFTTETESGKILAGEKTNPFVFISTGLKSKDPDAFPSDDRPDIYNNEIVSNFERVRHPFTPIGGLSDGSVIPGLGGTPDSFYYPIYHGFDSIGEDFAFSFDFSREDGTPSGDGKTRYNQTLFVALDAQPYLSRKFHYTPLKDAGASLYSNYTSNVRYVTEDDNYIPGNPDDYYWFNAAKNFLINSVGGLDTDEVFLQALPDEEEDDIGKAVIKVINSNAGGTGETKEKNRQKIRVSYTYSLFGARITVAADSAVNSSGIQFHKKEADPQAKIP